MGDCLQLLLLLLIELVLTRLLLLLLLDLHLNVVDGYFQVAFDCVVVRPLTIQLICFPYDILYFTFTPAAAADVCDLIMIQFINMALRPALKTVWHVFPRVRGVHVALGQY